MSEITCRLIRHEDYSELHQIRIKVFVDEQHFVEEIDDMDDACWHALLSVDGVPAGTARAYFMEDGTCKIGRVAVLPAYRGMHLGERVMTYLEGEMRKLGAERFLVGAQVRASGFYAKLGYTAHGEEYLDEYCPHINMYKPPFHA